MKNEEKTVCRKYDPFNVEGGNYPEVFLNDKAVVDFWHKQEVFKCKADKDFSKLYSIDTPPPTVSGRLHIGHIFSYTHADFLARYNRLAGKDVFYPMGFDDNGLATEKFVIKKRQLIPGRLSRDEFIKACLEETAVAREEFQALWTDLGLSIDWSEVYSTISPRVQRVSQTSFVRLFQKGLIERRAEPFMFCTTCQTAVAQAELDWQEKKGKFYKYKLSANVELSIATTRPELIFSCVAIMVHPEDERYKSLIGGSVTMPLSGKKVPVIADPAVAQEKGTGAVMCCTFGDQTDVFWYKKHGLELIETIDKNGKMKSNTPLAGLTVVQARAAVVKMLQEVQSLESEWEIDHGAHVHERCGQGVEFLVTNQWFVKIVNNKPTFLALADKIVWKPEHMKSRYIDWVENLSWDWCISRQRHFGIPIPVYYCQDCSTINIPEEHELPVSPIDDVGLRTCLKCKGANLKAETDVADTWLTSALTPLILQRWPDQTVFSPMAMRPCAHDIIRTWAFYTIVKTFYHTGQIPWKELNISGHVLAGKGEKISKSKENAQNSPPELIAQNSADAIRYWAASGKLGVDTVFEVEKIKNGKRTVTKLINAFKFVFGYIENDSRFMLRDDIKQDSLSTDLAKWLYSSFRVCRFAYHKAFSVNDYSGALDVLEQFFWSTFCDNYIELVKHKFFVPEQWAHHLDCERIVMIYVCRELLKMYSPFLPFVTEKLFSQYFCSDQSIAAQKFVECRTLKQEQATRFKDQVPPQDNTRPDLASVAREFPAFIWMLEAVSLVRKIKSEAKVSLKTPVRAMVVKCDSKNKDLVLNREHTALIIEFSKCVHNDFHIGWSESLFEAKIKEIGQGGIRLVSEDKSVEVCLWF